MIFGLMSDPAGLRPLMAYPMTHQMHVSISLQEALLRLKETYKVDILFEADAVAGLTVESRILQSQAGLESTLASVLSESGLQYKKIKKGTYVILSKAREKRSVSQAVLTTLPASPSVFVTQTPGKAVFRIAGRVTDESRQGLPGVNVYLKENTSVGATTDANGAYSLNVPDDQANGTLVFSYIGYKSQEVAINNRTEVNIQLEPDNQSLNEVVVIGYQSVRKKDLTGATGLVEIENTSKIVTRSAVESLQGQLSGVTIRNGGAPGQEAVIQIRGLSTLNGNANPLYIIDGMYADANTTVNPDDIASMQVLKDASAAAIYGSRAANGVVIITTKKGKEGPMKVSVSGRYTVSSVPRRWDVMNAQEYVDFNRRAYEAAGYALQPSVVNFNPATSPNTDWQDALIRTGSVQDYNLTLSGGGANSSYLISGSYFKDEGTLIKNNFERMSMRINTESKRGRFTFGENLMISNSVRNSPFSGGFAEGNPWYDLANNLPIVPVRDPSLISTSNPGGYGFGSINTRTFSRNQVAVAELTRNRSSFFKVLGNAYVDVKLFDWLQYRFNAGLETSFDNGGSIRREGLWYWNQSPEFSSTGENRSQFLSTLFEHTLNFNRTFGKHSINGVVGLVNQTIRNNNAFASRQQLTIANGQYFTTIGSATGGMTASGGNNQTLIGSYLGRLNYTYDDRYLLTLTFRSDKDSRFSPNYRRGNFPSVALGWRLSEEDFFKVDWINDLKIRGSYGVLGQANLGNYQYTGFITQGPRAVFGSDQTAFQGATQSRIVNENLRWEQKTTTNAGVDLSMFNNRFGVTLDVFRSIARDVLVQSPIPAYTGNLGGNPLTNIGSIQNQGIEMDLTYRNNDKDFKWSVSGNLSVIRNKVLELGNLGTDPETGQARNYIATTLTRSQVGRSIGEWFLLKTDGIFQNQGEIDAHRAQAAYAKPGDIRYVNAVDGGTNDDINALDRLFAGSPWPKLQAGLQFNGSYKNFSLAVQFYGSFGQQVYNDVRRDLDALGYSNYRRGIQPWTAENPNTDFPRIGVSYGTGVAGDPAVDRGIVSNARNDSDRWLESGSYLRIRNVELGYSIPKPLLTRFGLSDARVYVSGQNLYTFTGYSGLDPDIVGGNVILEPGLDVGNYPASRMVSLGLNLNF